MDELPRKARAFLKAAGRADDPTPAERARSERVLRNALAAHGVTGLPPLAAGEPTAETVAGRPRWARPRLGLPLKIGAAVVALAGAAYLGHVARTSPVHRTPPAAAQNALPLSDSADTQLAHSPALASRADHEESSAPSKPAPEPTSRLARANRSADNEPCARRSGSRACLNERKQRASHPVSDDLAEQLKTLEAANELVREGSYAAALRLLDRSEAPSAAVLREERMGLRVLARCAVAADALAQREREAFLRQYPRSVLAERVRGACAGAPGGAR